MESIHYHSTEAREKTEVPPVLEELRGKDSSSDKWRVDCLACRYLETSFHFVPVCDCSPFLSVSAFWNFHESVR